ncbi:hypothetical protein DQ384_02240 [Sphaerisporangium album]|uniref:Uncharacterized protein n=1 Tax=Sphaerisporangium album TaxID=509200 RepID=A0A367FU82_9ACTN|nr:hypothetical protein [Sphaerisporangium album]RCG33267.1 hypothetical protein DQ384_02240 [Sphaerisporangium album]
MIYKSKEGARAVEERYRAYLAHWPVPSEHLRLATRQGETFAVAGGPPDAGHLPLGQTSRILEFLRAPEKRRA